MMIVGSYLLFNAISVQTRFGFGMRLYGVRGIAITSGVLLLPFIAGVIGVFYNAANKLAWLLSIGSLIALVAGVLASIQFS